MIALAVISLLDTPRITAWPRLDVEPDGFFAQVDARAGDRQVAAETARIKVRIDGPCGFEPARLVKAPTKPGRSPQSWRIDIDRSPAGGWRQIKIDIRGTLPKAAKVEFPMGPTTLLRYYLPAIDPAPGDAALRRRWVGKKVWFLGAAAFTDSSFQRIVWDPHLPATILAIERVPTAVGFGYGYPIWAAEDGWDGGAFLGAGRLNVRLRVPKGAWQTDGGAPWGGHAKTERDSALPTGTEASFSVVDGWQLDRIISRTSPEEILKRERASVRNAFARRELAVGMPRSLVARLLGDPEPASLVQEVWRRPIWDWAGSAPFGFSISFDRNGRVKGYGHYGDLP